jgi:hypothetical protein
MRREILRKGLVLALSAPLLAVPVVARGAGWRASAAGLLQDVGAESAVREYDLRGTFLDLDRTPGLAPLGGSLRLSVGRDLGRFRLELTGSWSRNRSSGSAGTGFTFNGGTYPPGRAVTSTLTTWRLAAVGSYPFLRWSGNELRGLGGFEYYHPILAMDAHPAVPTHDRKEDFLQFLPLPVLGVDGSFALSPGWVLHARGLAGTARNWNTHRSEGGPMRMNLTLAEGELRLDRRIRGPYFLELGYDFRYAEGTLESGQDGNWIRSREHGLLLGLGVGE